MLLPLINIKDTKHPSVLLRSFLFGFLAGVGFSSFVRIEPMYVYVLFLTAIPVCIYARWISVFLIGISVGAIIYQYATLPPTFRDVSYYNGSHVSFTGTITREPDRRTDYARLTVDVQRLDDHKVRGRVLINAPLFPEYSFGDQLLINCNLEKPKPIDDFLYDRYLAKEGIKSLCRRPIIVFVSSGNGSWALQKIFDFKKQLQEKIEKNISEPQASLFSAMVLGTRGGLSGDLTNAFNVTGTIHLVAISGLNMVIIGTLLLQLGLALGLWRRHVFWVVTAGLAVYVVLIGFPASAVRAAIMAWVTLLAVYLGRLHSASSAVLFAASIMVVFNPLILRDDAGFQLSVAAVLGLIYLSPIFDRVFGNETGVIREGIKTTLAAQIATMPFVMVYFGRVSLIAPVVNLLVVPVASIITVIGFPVLLLSSILPGLGQIGFWFTEILLGTMIEIINIFSLVPYAAVTL